MSGHREAVTVRLGDDRTQLERCVLRLVGKPGVIIPPVAMTLMASQPPDGPLYHRGPKLLDAVRFSPRNQQCPPVGVMGGPATSSSGRVGSVRDRSRMFRPT